MLWDEGSRKEGGMLSHGPDKCCQIGRIPTQLGNFGSRYAGKITIGRVHTIQAGFGKTVRMNCQHFFTNIHTNKLRLTFRIDPIMLVLRGGRWTPVQ